jgi:hypothetical protein
MIVSCGALAGLDVADSFLSSTADLRRPYQLAAVNAGILFQDHDEDVS